jgi:hypothetical protein
MTDVLNARMTPQGLYVVEVEGEQRSVITHSMIKTMRRCAKQADYKYRQRLKVKTTNVHLKRGLWMHYLLEEHHAGRDWKVKHKELTKEFNKLFDEEREYYGDMPGDCARVMRGYIWHYREASDWIVHETEFSLDVPFPDGTIYRCKIDALVEDDYGLWLVDHKTHKTLPNLGFRLLDSQSALYIWAALRSKIPVQGFIWNYVRWKAPTVPKLVQSGKRLSAVKIDTDYPTFLSAIKEYGLDPADYQDQLRALKSHRYKPGMTQTSSFYLRSTLEKDNFVLKQVASEGFKTAKRMNTYNFDGVVERSPDRRCTWDCAYPELCQVELLGGNAEFLRRKLYTIGDPNDYYEDRAGDYDKENEG